MPHLRLRLAAKKAVWEISAPESADGAERFVPIAVNELRDYLYAPDEAAFELAATSLALAALLRVRLSRSNRIALKLSEADDRAFLARLLSHPHARALRPAHRLVLTGTPIENRLLDLWSLFAFAQPGLLGGQTAFKRLHNDKADPAGARSRLALRVKNPRDFDTQRFNIFQSLLRLRQICCDPRLLGVDAPPKSARRKAGTSKSRANAPDMPNSLPPPSAKLEALLDPLEPLIAEGHKVLVFSQFVTMLELIRVELTVRGIAHLMLTGLTANRQQLVDTFQADPAITVFLLSLKAAGSGLNQWLNGSVGATRAVARSKQADDRKNRIYRMDSVGGRADAMRLHRSPLARRPVAHQNSGIQGACRNRFPSVTPPLSPKKKD